MRFILSSLKSSQSTVDFLADTLRHYRGEHRRNRPLLKGWVNLRLNIRLKGYVYRQHLYTVR